MKLEPFHTLDHHGNEYVIQHGNVATDVPTTVTLWPLSVWQCVTCDGIIHWIESPTGGWWAHAEHPSDEHEAVPVE